MAVRTGDFRLYHSNALDVLAGLLAETLRTPASGQPLLAPDVVLIPQVAMRRWLQATLAARHGIAANLEFLTPGEFVARALAANPAPDAAAGEELDADSLHWHLYAALLDPALRARPALAQLAAYLDGDDPLKAWTLAGELAGVFGKYQAWRRDWLLRWDDGADRDDPQAILWRAAIGGRGHRARRIQDYLARFAENEGNRGALPAGLPPRLFAFATLNISPDVLRVLATQSRVGTLHFYLPTPSKAASVSAAYSRHCRLAASRSSVALPRFASSARDTNSPGVRNSRLAATPCRCASVACSQRRIAACGISTMSGASSGCPGAGARSSSASSPASTSSALEW
jgi:exodeoxyribonuclease V gamma subunit